MDVKTRILDLLEAGSYVYTDKADQLARECGLEHEDVVESIRTGAVKAYGKGEDGLMVWEWKGRALSGRLVYSQGKVDWEENDGSYYLIITAHWPR